MSPGRDKSANADAAPEGRCYDLEDQNGRLVLSIYCVIQDPLILENLRDDFATALGAHGAALEFIANYEDFEEGDPSQLSHDMNKDVLRAFKIIGLTRYVRVLPERLESHLRERVGYMQDMDTAFGLKVVTVRTLKEAHAYFDAHPGAAAS